MGSDVATVKLALGLSLALASAAALNWGYIAQHTETARVIIGAAVLARGGAPGATGLQQQ